MFVLNSILQQLLLQLFLILLNAFFAATEIAVISLNPTKLRKLEEQGDLCYNVFNYYFSLKGLLLHDV